MDERETLKQMLKLACVQFKQVKVQGTKRLFQNIVKFVLE
jgi:hypothetical protein